MFKHDYIMSKVRQIMSEIGSIDEADDPGLARKIYTVIEEVLEMELKK